MASTIYNPNTMSSSDIKTMQNALIKAGYSVGSSGADGIWGKDTAAALSAYKKDTGGSNSSGYSVGNETFKKLYGTGGSNSNTTGTTGSTVTTKNQPYYVVKAGDTGYNADVANKAAAYLSGGVYTPGQAIDTDWWGAGGGKALMYGNNNTYKGQAMTTTDMEKAAYYAKLYDQAQQAAYEQQMMEYPNQIYNQMMDMISSQNAQNQAASQQRTQQIVNSIRGNETYINNAYQEAQRQAYINQALQRAQMGDYLSANGYTGGIAESTLAQLASNYENNRRNATSERDAALRQIEQLIAEAQANGNSVLADIANNYMNNAISAMQNQAQMSYQVQQAQREQQNIDREYQLALMQQKLARKQYEDDLAASKADQDFKTFLDTYEGKYNKQSTYEDWIKNLKAKDDPYGYNAQKIAYLTQYINSGIGKSNLQAGSVASSGNSTKSTKTTQNGPSNVANYDQILKTAGLIKSTNSFYGPQGAVDYIEKSGLTDFEKNKAFKALGLL